MAPSPEEKFILVADRPKISSDERWLAYTTCNGVRGADIRLSDAVELRKELQRRLALADAAADPAMRKGFIRLALHYAELAFEFEKRERAEADLSADQATP